MRLARSHGCWLAALAAAAMPAHAQNLTPAAEATPRYWIEVIGFRYEDFDPTEEHLDVVPPESKLQARSALPPRRYVDRGMLDALYRQVDAPIDGPRPDPGVLPPFSDDILALDYFSMTNPSGLNLRVLAPEELELGGVLARLERLDAYTPLFHGGWEQDGLTEDVAIPFLIGNLGVTNPRGSIRLHVSRYLHVTVDLAYEPPEYPPSPATPSVPPATPLPPSATAPSPGSGFGPASAPAQPPLPYHLYEQRRILRGELNYFDHPAFGLVLTIRLAPEADAGPESSAPAPGPSA